jgi:hypothetical protein
MHTNAVACGSCSTENSFLNAVSPADPASYRVVYTGIEGLILDEYVRFVTRKWLEDLDLRYHRGDLGEFALSHSYRRLAYYREDYFSSSFTDKRSEWWHYTEDWGPIRLYHTGPISDIINIGPIRVNNRFRFKLKDYETDISSKWSYKFKPIVRVTSKLPLIRVLGIGNTFVYKNRGKKLIRLFAGIGFNFVRMDAVVEIQIELPEW